MATANAHPQIPSARIAECLGEVSGFRLTEHLPDSADATFAQALEESGCADLDEFTSYLKSEIGRHTARTLIGELTIKETYFFRTPEQFDLLGAALLGHAGDELSDRLDVAKGIPIRIWSAGCSTGEEPYSIAMTVLQTLGTHADRAYVLASDISTGALEHARRGHYRDPRVPPRLGIKREHLLARFVPADEDGLHTVAPSIRHLVHFMPHDVMNDAPPLGQDIVFCRNLMIYLSPQDQRALVDRLWRSLKPGGLLFLGDAELLHVMKHRFETVDALGAVAYRKPWQQAA